MNSVAGKVLRWPLRLIPPGTRVPILQGPLRGQRWLVGSGNHGCWLGSYEMAKQRLFGETVAPATIVFDIGAHVGFYTLLASLLVGHAGQVFAFEPLPQNLLYLREHLRLNKIANVSVIDAAVTSQRGTVNFVGGPSTSTGHIAAQGQHQVRGTSLDDFVFQENNPPPDYLKIDVEGAEVEALAGGRAVLARWRPTIFLATHSEQLRHSCCQLLLALGYSLGTIGKPSEILASHDRQVKQRA